MAAAHLEDQEIRVLKKPLCMEVGGCKVREEELWKHYTAAVVMNCFCLAALFGSRCSCPVPGRNKKIPVWEEQCWGARVCNWLGVFGEIVDFIDVVTLAFRVMGILLLHGLVEYPADHPFLLLPPKEKKSRDLNLFTTSMLLWQKGSHPCRRNFTSCYFPQFTPSN